jgi:circadian clock protein KaiC
MTDHRSDARLETGLPGFDLISNGGLPWGRTTLVAGTSGCGKTLMVLQYLVSGVRDYGQKGVCVTFEETPDDLVRNVQSFGWHLDEMVASGKIAFVDGTPSPGETHVESGQYDLSALLARIERAVVAVGATRVGIDALGGLLAQFADPETVRRELRRVFAGLRRLGVTSLITIERTDEDGGVGRLDVEEFVADNVLILRNRLELERRRRTIEILKFRGATHHKGEYPFTIDAEEGVTIIPLSAMELGQKSSDVRVSSGVPELDSMCGGGIYRDSIILVSGATGTGKTLMVTEYIKAAIAAGERALLLAAEESRAQLSRNAAAWGVDFEEAERKGLLRIICRYPEAMGLEDHLLQIRREVREFRPSRLAVDSMSAFERGASTKSFREFVIALTGFIKQQEVTGLFTNTAPMLIGGESITETHISTITDTIILLRYVELYGEMRRGLTVLKMRGTWHQKDIREYVIDNTGMHIQEPFRQVRGILSGSPSYVLGEERDRLGAMFE